jgi:hypothetical protein
MIRIQFFISIEVFYSGDLGVSNSIVLPVFVLEKKCL